MAQTDFIDELMEVSVNLTAFQTNSSKSNGNPNIYKTNPTTVNKDIAPDGHYHSKIRIIYNPFQKEQSIVHRAQYAFFDSEGFFMLDSKLSSNDRSCRIFKDWKSLHFSDDPEVVITTSVNGKPTQMNRKQWGDHMFDKSETNHCLVQIIEDQNQPELVGKIMAMKVPAAIFAMINSKMYPTDVNKPKQDLMNYVFGPALVMDVTPGPDDPSDPSRKTREIKYNLCEFESDPTPIIKVTGEEFFNEDELDMINTYAECKKVLSNAKATAKKKADATETCKGLVEDLKKLMNRAAEYIKENSIDLVQECGYHEPTEDQWNRYAKWADLVINKFKDPATHVESTVSTPVQKTEHIAEPDANQPAVMDDENDDLPF